jgi:predicted type IV restriction endonuclease
LKDRILSFVIRVKENPALRTVDEAAIKQAVVVPLLRILGWNVENINEVFPEYKGPCDTGR